MASATRNRGPWSQRLLVWAFTVALGFLSFWLTGFVLSDIGGWPGPDYEALEKSLLDPQLAEQSDALNRQLEDTVRSIERETGAQEVLRESTAEAQRTMAQLLDFQRLAIEKGVTPTAEEQQALADSQSLFLDNQRQFQELNQKIGQLETERDALQERQRKLETQLSAARQPIEQQFAKLWEQHRLRVAGLKLAVMVPLLIVSAALFLKWRSSLYAPLIYALGAAVVVRTGLVLHEYFPARWFKYILIGTSLVVVLRTLLYLVRSIAYPKQDWLLKQYRESYERFLCPICEYPIRRGPLKFLFWTRGSAKKLALRTSLANGDDAPYTCPVCATRLFEKCSACQGTRHVLLPACEHCGRAEPVAAASAMTS